MPLTIGTQIGSHEITALLGKGGMGEVYRARDVKLKRDVAIKILPEEFASDSDRVARFQREAEVLASLNHPNIAAIHDLEETNGTRYLVLELVEGETLADRIARGPVPVEEALQIAVQISQALEAAHERGIIHRDLKPANVKITPLGKVKVLDFGLAKAFQDQQTTALSNSPTLMTASVQGMILGTAGYMSPEQAKGRDAGRESDMWSFGCVLYEMLTGRPAFEGETVGEVLAEIFKVEPEWQRLPVDTPDALRRLLRRCLQKDRTLRLKSADAARLEIEDARIGLAGGAAETVQTSPRPKGHLAWISAVALLVVIAAALTPFAIGYFRLGSKGADTVRFFVLPPEKVKFVTGTDAPYMAISPDGRRLAYIAISDGVPKVWIRPIDSVEARPLSGTEGIVVNGFPFWSSDGRSIGFFAQGKVRKIEVTGGPALSLCDYTVAASASGTWNQNGVILFDNGNGPSGPLNMVSAAGGNRRRLPC
jgi:hypothetical protein